LAAPSTANGVPTFRALDATDIPDISGTYLKLAGGTMTGAINRYYSAASTDPVVRLNSNNQDAILWYMGHGTSATAAPTNSYRLLYKGTGTAPNNYLQLIAHHTADVTAVQIDETGNITLGANVTLKADPTANL
jgi:hypothetical protein